MSMGDRFELWRRRKEIQDKINELTRKKQRATNNIQNFNVLKREITREAEKWNRAEGNFRGIMLEPIRVMYCFEGYAADHLTQKVPPAIDEMTVAATRVNGLLGGIEDQVSKLDQYCTELEQKIETLEMEIDALGDML